MEEKNIKVYQVGDVDWIASENPEQALKCHFDSQGNEDFTIEDVVEMSKEIMDEFKFHDSDVDSENYISFSERLKQLIDAGEKFPQHFASSEW